MGREAESKRRCARPVVALSLLVLVQLVAAPALAHPKIDEAATRLETAEFESALRLLAEAEAGSDLSREDALRLLELRALVHLALKERERAAQALRLLAVLSPEHRFPEQTSPDLIAEFERVRQSAPDAPELSIDRALRPDGIALHANIAGDELGIAQGVRLWTRVGARPWRSTLAFETVVLAAPGERVEYRAVAHGLGGAPVLMTEASSVLIPKGKDEPVARGTSPWLYAGVIGGVVAAVGVTALVLLGGDAAQGTRVAPPMVVAP